MSTPSEQWANLTHQETLPEGHNAAPQGVNLEAPSLPGANIVPSANQKSPGFVPIHFAIVQSFLVGANPDTLTDTIMDAIIKQAEKLTDKLLAHYPDYAHLVSNLSTVKVPDNWKH